MNLTYSILTGNLFILTENTLILKEKNTNSDLEQVDTYRKFTDIDLVKIHKYCTYRKVSDTDSKCTDTY